MSLVEQITQQVRPRITILWADSKYMDNLVITSNYQEKTHSTQVPAANHAFTTKQAANGFSKATTRWAVTDAKSPNGGIIRCDSGYVVFTGPQPYTHDNDQGRGWWSKRISNSSGDFLTPQWLQFDFDARLANEIKVVTSEFYGPIKTYRLYYKNSSDSWQTVGSTWTMSGNEKTHSLGADLTIKGVRIEVLSTRYPNDAARIQEIDPRYVEELDVDDVVSLSVNKIKENMDSTVPIGTSGANGMDLVLDNTTGKWNPEGDNPAALYMRKNVQFEVELGWYNGSGYTYVPFGYFYSDDWNLSGSGMDLNVSCRDYSKFLIDGAPLEYGFLYEDIHAGHAIRNLALIAGVPESQIQIKHLGRKLNAVYDKDVSPWEAMTKIAQADMGMFWFDEWETLIYDSCETVYERSSSYDLSDSTNIIDGEIPIQVQANRIVVQINPADVGATGLQGIWQSDDTWLPVTTLSGSVSSDDTEITLAKVNAIDVFFDTINGIVKIDDELIKYAEIDGNTLTGCERGQFNTNPSSHTSGVLVRGAVEYKIDYGSAPVKMPRIEVAAIKHEDPDLVELDIWEPGPYTAHLVISATGAEGADKYATVAGSIERNSEADEETIYYTAVAGVPLAVDDSKKKAEESVAEDSNSMRRYGRIDLTIDNPFIFTKAHAKEITDFLLDKFSNPVNILRLELLCVPTLQLDQVVTVTEYAQLGITNEEYAVIEVNTEYDGGVKQTVVLKALEGSE